VTGRTKRDGIVYTFYSFKGGVGRSMALANVAALLSRDGKRVLVLDWDLEAPGVGKYFAQTLDGSDATPGLVDLFDGLRTSRRLDWHDCLRHAQPFPDCEPIHFIGAGRPAGYAGRLQGLHWETLFSDPAVRMGDYLEDLREEWKTDYDAVLVDSRTGLTDIGGICTIHLPDVVVVLFTANQQNLEGLRDTMREARSRHAALPVDRRRLAIVPVPSRDETHRIIRQGAIWQKRFEEHLGEFYKDWLPPDVRPTDAIKVLKIPYIAEWSFGEPLPVVEEGTTDPASLGFAFELLSRLLRSKLDWREVTHGTLAAAHAESRAQAAQEKLADTRKAVRWISWGVAALALVVGAGLVRQRQLEARRQEEEKQQAELERSQRIFAIASKSDDNLESALVIADAGKLVVRDEALATLRAIAAAPIPVAVLRGYRGVVGPMAFSADGTKLATGSSASAVSIWRTDGTGAPVVLPGKSILRTIAFAANDQLLALVDGDQLRAANLTGGPAIFMEAKLSLGIGLDTLQEQSGYLFAGDFEKLLASKIEVGGHGLGPWISLYKGSSPPFRPVVTGAQAVPRKDGAFTVAVGGGLLIWQPAPKPGTEVVLKPLGGAGFSDVSVLDPSGRFGAIATRNGAKIVDLESGTAVQSIGSDRFIGVLSLGSSFVATLTHGLEMSSGEGRLEIWPLPLRDRTSFLVPEPVDRFAVSPDGRWAVTTGKDGSAHAWRLGERGKQVPLALGGQRGYTNILFSRDGSLVATAAADRTVRLWKLDQPPDATAATADQLLVQLARSTTACLTTDQRVRLLAETPDPAKEKYEACERSHGRTPVYEAPNAPLK
jgi:WD40 repeat protein/cellulose biosynthesis protein BcsQ